MQPPMLELNGIAKSYDSGVKVISDLSLSVDPGEIFFLIGPSGCGKSTLLRIVAGLLAPDRGEIHIDGQNTTATAPEKRRTAMVFQNYALWPHLNVAENVGFAARIAGKSRAEESALVQEALKSVRMEEFEKRKIQSLSGGQQQRIALARALAAAPRILLLDEPLSNLDAKLRDTMRLEIRRILRERHLTALYVTHDRREAMSIADRIAVLRNGNIEQIGAPRELYCNPANRFVAEFLGPATFLSGHGKADGRVETPLGVFRGATTAADGAAVALMLRPEIWKNAVDGAENTLEFICKDCTFLGDRFECRMTAKEMDFEINFLPDGSEPPRPGETRRLCFAPAAAAVLKD